MSSVMRSRRSCPVDLVRAFSQTFEANLCRETIEGRSAVRFGCFESSVGTESSKQEPLYSRHTTFPFILATTFFRSFSAPTSMTL